MFAELKKLYNFTSNNNESKKMENHSEFDLLALSLYHYSFLPLAAHIFLEPVIHLGYKGTSSGIIISINNN